MSPQSSPMRRAPLRLTLRKMPRLWDWISVSCEKGRRSGPVYPVNLPEYRAPTRWRTTVNQSVQMWGMRVAGSLPLLVTANCGGARRETHELPLRGRTRREQPGHQCVGSVHTTGTNRSSNRPLETPGVLRGRKSDRHVQLLPVNRVGPGCGAGQHSAARARTAEDPCRPSVGGGLVGACRPESRAGAVGRSQVHPPRHSTSQNVSVPRGHLRERFELDHATFFGAASGESGQWILSRLEWHADLRLGNHVQLFTQFQNAVAPGKARLKPVDQDRLDVEQAFIGLTEPLGGGTLRLRLGDRSLPSSSRDLRRFARARICVSPMTRRSRTTRAAGGTSSVPMSNRFRLRTYTRLTTTAITT